PSWAHWLGTDEVGRDVLSRVIWGARASLSAGLVSVGIALGIGVPLGLLLSGSILALLFAHVVRFLSVAASAVDSGLGRITPSMDDAARTLGAAPSRVLARVHAPMMRGSVLVAVVLVFVDVLKELPATLLVRPFNFDTLAVHVHALASDERLAQAAAPALAIVLAGLAPVAILAAMMRRGRGGDGAA
ncbi:MAG: hypothetical protein ACO3EK_13705, partial [Alphaproteobacteria bacterium]